MQRTELSGQRNHQGERAFRHGFLGTSDVDPGLAFVIMGAFAVAMFTIVVVLMNRGANSLEERVLPAGDPFH